MPGVDVTTPVTLSLLIDSFFVATMLIRDLWVAGGPCNPDVGGPLPGLTMSCEAKPTPFDHLCHSLNRMDKRSKRIALESA